MMKHIPQKNSLLARILIVCIVIVRPLLGPATCRFYVGCTAYAIDQLQTERLHYALLNISKRLLSCNPFW
ncbi:MAG TPA: membrane protein insertion efficiency factor YidD [Candidatus Babeliales bacterium]|jgi:putative component of membrane protein insertase Oxa1/YidC/SpoIIIJ protein YidD|nr:membrane protein insertion efficiency factor YidD [Candidatus Babeliales bacterium]